MSSCEERKGVSERKSRSGRAAAAHAWLQSLREPTVGKDIVATQSNTQFDDETLEKIIAFAMLSQTVHAMSAGRVVSVFERKMHALMSTRSLTRIQKDNPVLCELRHNADF
jgi:hypothetical protein